MKSNELRKHIIDTIYSFVGSEKSIKEVEIEMFNAVAKIIKENPKKLNFIEKVIKETSNEKLY